MTFTLRISEDDSNLIRDYAKLHGLSVSEFLRRAALERIEDEIDLETYRRAKEEFDSDPVTYSHDDVERMLGLK